MRVWVLAALLAPGALGCAAGARRVDLGVLPGGAVAGALRIATVWGGIDGPVAQRFFAPDAADVAFAPDGERIAVAARPSVVLDVTSGRRLLVLDSGALPPLDIAWSPDGRTIAAAEIGGAVSWWDAVTGRRLGRARLPPEAGVDALTFSPDSGSLAIAGGEGTLARFSLARKAPDWIVATSTHGGLDVRAAWLASGKIVVAGRGAQVFDGESGRLLSSQPGGGVHALFVPLDGDPRVAGDRNAAVRAATPLSRGRFAVIGSFGLEIRRAPAGRLVKRARFGAGELLGSPRSDAVFAIRRDRRARLVPWDVEAGRPAMIADAHLGAVLALAPAPGGGLVSAGADGRVLVRDAAGAVVAARRAAGETAAWALAGDVALGASRQLEEAQRDLWAPGLERIELGASNERAIWERPARRLFASRGGSRFLAVRGDDVELLEARGGAVLGQWQGQGFEGAAALGDTFLVGDRAGLREILPDGSERRVADFRAVPLAAGDDEVFLALPGGTIEARAWPSLAPRWATPSGARLAAVSATHVALAGDEVVLLDARDGKRLGRFSLGADDAASALAFSADGGLLYVGTEAGLVVVLGVAIP